MPANAPSPRAPQAGAGQVVLPWAQAELAPPEQVRALARLNDPALSELAFEELLDELLERVQEALAVDTVAILLHDRDSHQLVARAARGIEEEVERGVRIPLGRGFAGRIAAEHAAIFIADVDHADILNPILREKGIRSLLGVPLVVEGELIGVLHVGSLHPRTFGAREVGVLQVAAARAAPEIERARLASQLEQERGVAMALQRSLLPTRLAQIAGVAIAARYLPASHEVGGDWYDVFELAGGRVGVAIGDVVGHGVVAAALMGQLRTALRAYATEGHGPARTLELVDRFVQEMPDEAMATAAYGILDIDRRALRLASAGHLPPILVEAGGARLLDVVPAPPLGAFPRTSYDEQQFALQEGDTLALYTDGLIERRLVPLTDSMARLCELLAGASSPEEACQMAIDEMAPLAPRRDDVAIMAIQLLGVPGSGASDPR
jgi:serine phosphatase RsbU (regulator of sigma subunit)